MDTKQKVEVLGILEQALANYRSCFEATDYILAWDNGFAVKGSNAVSVWNADAVEQNDTRRWLNGMNERASPKLRSEVAKQEYKKLCLALAKVLD